MFFQEATPRKTPKKDDEAPPTPVLDLPCSQIALIKAEELEAVQILLETF